MRRHLIAGHYGTADTPAVTQEAGVCVTTFDLQHSGTIFLGLGAALADLASKGVFPSETAIDLAVVAAHVQLADTRISRLSESQDSWTREITLLVPVKKPQLWEGAAPTLVRTLNFLTGDMWTLNFRQKPDSASNLIPTGLPLAGVQFDKVALFSGGLDSWTGAIDAVQSGATPLFISHAGDGMTSSVQEECIQKLRDAYPKNGFDRLRLWMDLKGLHVEGSERENTTRGRSFLFFSTGILAGSGIGNGDFTLDVPENGLIALNVPLDPLRLGSHSTRTTHPFYVNKWNELLKKLEIPGKIVNPYYNKTKGEMIASCSNKKLLEATASLTTSCSSPTKGRWQKVPNQHCGYCLPCVIRRAALLRGFGTDKDQTTYTVQDLSARTLDSKEAEGKQIRSFKLASKVLQKQPNLARIRVHSSGSLTHLSSEVQEELVDVYKRGLTEVEGLLKNVRTKPS